jgi:hypothetical protein
MKIPRELFSATFAFTCLLLLASGCDHHSDAALRERLVGSWRSSGNDGQNQMFSDLTFTIATNGNYSSQITIPQPHSIEGSTEIKNGFLIVTVTNRDNTNVLPHDIARQEIIRVDEGELSLRSEGSDVKNYFRKLQRTRGGP